jgi:hypothetical protein
MVDAGNLLKNFWFQKPFTPQPPASKANCHLSQEAIGEGGSIIKRITCESCPYKQQKHP